jgi:hypothetical protein
LPPTLTRACRTRLSADTLARLHELTFAILFLAILAFPFRAPQRWAWFTCWALLIAYLGYTLTYAAHDSNILPCSLIGAIGLPVLLIASAPAFFRKRAADALDDT